MIEPLTYMRASKAASTPRWPSALAAGNGASRYRWVRSAIASTMRWPRASSRPWSASCSTERRCQRTPKHGRRCSSSSRGGTPRELRTAPSPNPPGVLQAALEEEAARWFGCDQASPFMLFTHCARTKALAAVTHVNGTARIQTVSSVTNRKLYELLVAFKARTGYGVLCNTSLNFKGRGFINKMADLSAYAVMRGLDGFVVEGRAYLMRSSTGYRSYLKMPNRQSITVYGSR